MKTLLLLAASALALPVAALAEQNCYAPGMTTWQRQRCEIEQHEAAARASKAGGCGFYTSLNDRKNCERWGDPPPMAELLRRQQQPSVTINVPPPVIINEPPPVIIFER